MHRYPLHISVSFKVRSERVSSLFKSSFAFKLCKWTTLSSSLLHSWSSLSELRNIIWTLFTGTVENNRLPSWGPCCSSVCLCCLCKHSRCRCATGERPRTRSHLEMLFSYTLYKKLYDRYSQYLTLWPLRLGKGYVELVRIIRMQQNILIFNIS